MAHGYGFDVSDWVLIGVLAVGGYFAYKMIIKPTSDITGGASDIVTTIENQFQKQIATLSDLFNAGEKKLIGLGGDFSNLLAQLTKNNQDYNQQLIDKATNAFNKLGTKSTIQTTSGTYYFGSYSAPIMHTTDKNNPLQIGYNPKTNEYNIFALQTLGKLNPKWTAGSPYKKYI